MAKAERAAAHLCSRHAPGVIPAPVDHLAGRQEAEIEHEPAGRRGVGQLIRQGTPIVMGVNSQHAHT